MHAFTSVIEKRGIETGNATVDHYVLCSTTEI